MIFYSDGAKSWFCQRQKLVTISTKKAEIIDANECIEEVILLNYLFSDITQLNGIPLHQTDNIATIRLAKNPEFYHCTKLNNIK